jgi:hypothetical protein
MKMTGKYFWHEHACSVFNVIFFFADSIRGQIQTQNDLDDIAKNLCIKVEVFNT